MVILPPIQNNQHWCSMHIGTVHYYKLVIYQSEIARINCDFNARRGPFFSLLVGVCLVSLRALECWAEHLLRVLMTPHSNRFKASILGFAEIEIFMALAMNTMEQMSDHKSHFFFANSPDKLVRPFCIVSHYSRINFHSVWKFLKKSHFLKNVHVKISKPRKSRILNFV